MWIRRNWTGTIDHGLLTGMNDCGRLINEKKKKKTEMHSNIDLSKLHKKVAPKWLFLLLIKLTILGGRGLMNMKGGY